MGWRRKGSVCWTVTDWGERWYPTKVRIVRRGLWRYNLYDLIARDSLHGVPWHRLRATLKAARRMARRMNQGG